MKQKTDVITLSSTTPEQVTTARESNLSSYRILVVDPSREIRMLIATFLRGYGFTVETQPGGMEALLQLYFAEDRFSLVITEIELSPGLTGYDFINSIRKFAPDIPIMAMTDQTVQSKNIFDQVVIKPFLLKSMLKKCLTLLPDVVLPERWHPPHQTVFDVI